MGVTMMSLIKLRFSAVQVSHRTSYELLDSVSGLAGAGVTIDGKASVTFLIFWMLCYVMTKVQLDIGPFMDNNDLQRDSFFLYTTSLS